MPRCFSMAIQSEVAWRSDFLAFTVPATWMILPSNSNFSVIVVLPASGCEIIASTRRRLISCSKVSVVMTLAVANRRQQHPADGDLLR